MSRGRRIEIEVVGKDNASKVFVNLNEQAETFGQKLGRVGEVASGFVLGKAITEGPGFLMDAVKAAQEDEAAMIMLQQAVTNAEGAYDDYAGSIDDAIQASRRKGFDDTTTSQALALLVANTGSAEEAMERLSLAQDLARGTGMDLETAAKLLGRVTDENISVLSRYGISVEKGASAQELLNEVDARFGGQAAAYAESSAGQFAIAADKVGELRESIGYALMPVMVALISVVGDLAEKLQMVLGPAFGAIQQAISGLMPILDPIIGFIQDNLTAVFIGLATMLLTVVVPAFVAWAGAAATAAAATIVALAPVIATAAAIGAAVAGLYIIWEKNLFGVRDIAQQVFGWIRDNVPPIVERVRDIVMSVVGTITGFIREHGDEIQAIVSAAWGFIQGSIENVLGIIKGIVDFWVSVFQGDWSGAWEAVKDITGAIWDQIKLVISTALDIIKNLFPIALDLIKSTISLAWEGIRTGASLAWDAIKEVIRLAWERIKEAVSGAIDSVVEFVSGLPGRAVDALGDLGSLLHEQGKALVQGLIDGIKDMLGPLGDAVGWIGDQLGKIDVPGFSPPGEAGDEIGTQYASSIAAAIRRWIPAIARNVAMIGETMGGAYSYTGPGASFVHPPDWSSVLPPAPGPAGIYTGTTTGPGGGTGMATRERESVPVNVTVQLDSGVLVRSWGNRVALGQDLNVGVG